MTAKNVYLTNHIFIMTTNQYQAKLLANKVGNCRVCMSDQEDMPPS